MLVAKQYLMVPLVSLRKERTDSSFFQAVFTRVVIESSQLPAAESMSPR